VVLQERYRASEQLVCRVVGQHRSTQRHAAKVANQARMVAGYCWNWASKYHPNAWDINIEPWGYRARWNLSKDGSVWIMKPGTVEEVGCIHTCQGLELETIGVIIGPDLAYRDGQVVTAPTARARTDQSLKGYRVGLKRDPQATDEPGHEGVRGVCL
jgi:DUF2075 family protein